MTDQMYPEARMMKNNPTIINVVNVLIHQFCHFLLGASAVKRVTGVSFSFDILKVKREKFMLSRTTIRIIYLPFLAERGD